MVDVNVRSFSGGMGFLFEFGRCYSKQLSDGVVPSPDDGADLDTTSRDDAEAPSI